MEKKMKNNLTNQDILAVVSANRKKFDEKGVSYYNKDNKDNKDNRDAEMKPLSLDRTTSSEATPLNQAEESLLDDASIKPQGSLDPEGQEGERSCLVIEKAETPPRLGIKDPAITPEEVDRCLLTFYDNGADARMRYRLAITINPNETASERWEFIANLNKDRRIFMRNIPEENREFVVDFGNVMRAECKQKYRNYPMLGKIHNNSKRQAFSVNQKEDGCAAAVYWTGSEWLATVMLWEYVIKDIPLIDSLLTDRQKKQNIRGVSGILYGPNSVTQAKWQERARPTFKSRKK